MEYYNFMDKDGDGIDVNELLAFVKQVNKEKSTLGPQTFANPAQARVYRKRQTYRQKLAEGMTRSASLPSLGSPSFTALGRDHKPSTRFAVDRAEAIFT